MLTSNSKEVMFICIGLCFFVQQLIKLSWKEISVGGMLSDKEDTNNLVRTDVEHCDDALYFTFTLPGSGVGR